jgi:hypothetical protein
VQPERFAPPSGADPGNVIIDRELRELYRSFVDSIRGFHSGVELEVNQLEVWARFEDELLCRIVPYRELFHVLVGRENVWEVRVKNRSGCLETLDRVLSRFLEVYAKRSSGRPARSSGSSL